MNLLRVPIFGAAMFAACVSLLTGCAAPRAGVSPVASTASDQVVNLPGKGLTLSAVLFTPTAVTPMPQRHPAIVLMHGCGGMLNARGQLTAGYRAWSERLAQWGFVTLALDSFSPRGAGSICAIPGAQRPANPWTDRTADAYAALAWLARRPDVDPGRIFVMGWSHGGSTVMGVVRPEALAGAADGLRFRAAIAFYPGCPRPPALNSYRVSMPLLILHGEADDWVPAAPCVELAKHFATGSIPVRTIVFPGAHHGFDGLSDRIVYRPDVFVRAAPDGRGAHVGGHEASRVQAIAEARSFLNGFIAQAGPGARR